MDAYIASSSRPWIIDSGVSSHMACIQNKFDSLNLSKKNSSVNIADDTQSRMFGNEVVHASPSLTFTGALYVLKFPVSLFSISQFTKQNNCKVTFFPSCVFFGT